MIAIDNQFHLNLRNRRDLVAKLSDREVVKRWLRLSSKRLDLKPEAKQKQIEKYLANREWVAERRRRLSSIRWFMRMLKEPIAREANAEDGVRGHFFGERFDSFKLEDDEQILVASLHINALAVNSGLADSVEAARIKSVGRPVDEGGNLPVAATHELPGAERASETNARVAEGGHGAVVDHEPAADHGVAVESNADVNVERTSSSKPAHETCGGDAGAVEGSSFRHRLPLEDYCQWLTQRVEPRKQGCSVAVGGPSAVSQEAGANKADGKEGDGNEEAGNEEAGNVTVGADVGGHKAGGETAVRAGKRRGFDPGISAFVAPTLEVPEQLPSGWEKFGLDSGRWAEAVPLIAHRFRRYAYRAAALRLDC